jgi:DNA mismatch endonuclease Vsr
MADDTESAGLTGIQPSESGAAVRSAAGDVTARKRAYPAPSSAGRSANMRANRRTDTKPELALRRALHGQGYRYRKDHRLDLAPGVRVRPDIVFTARKIAVFVDGCF